MRGRIVEITGNTRHLALHRGFLTVSEKDTEIGRIDLDTILSIIIASRGATITNAVFAECAGRSIPVLICDNRYQPVSMMTPTIHHFDQNNRYHLQATLSKGKRNQLWQYIVKAKIKNQAAVLKTIDAPSVERLLRIASEVKSGDMGNGEAQAAQIYWRSLFGNDFRRNQNGDGLNALLNYGYAIIRGAMTRAILTAGLHPTFGLHHHNSNNAFCLVDDLMEPYRPLVDQVVHYLNDKGQTDLNAEIKAILARIVMSDTASDHMLSPLGQHMVRCSQGYLGNLGENKVAIPIPQILTPVELMVLLKSC